MEVVLIAAATALIGSLFIAGAGAWEYLRGRRGFGRGILAAVALVWAIAVGLGLLLALLPEGGLFVAALVLPIIAGLGYLVIASKGTRAEDDRRRVLFIGLGIASLALAASGACH